MKDFLEFNFKNCCLWKKLASALRVIIKTISGRFPLSWQDGIGGALVNYSMKGATGKAVTIDGVEYVAPDGYTVLLNGIGNKNNYATIPSLTIDTTDTLHAEFTLTDRGNRMFGNQSASTRCYVAASGNGTSMFCGKTYPVPLSEWTIDGSTINTLEMDASGITVNGNEHTWSGGTLAQDVITNFVINEIVGGTSGTTTSVSGFCLFLLKDANSNHKNAVMFLRKDSDNSVVCYDFAKKVFYTVTGTFTAGKTTKTVEVGGQSIEVPLFHYRGVGDKTSNLWDKSKSNTNWINGTGAIVSYPNGSAQMSDFVDCEEGDTFTIRGFRNGAVFAYGQMEIAWFNSSKTFIRRDSSTESDINVLTATAPTKAMYCKYGVYRQGEQNTPLNNYIG